MIRKKDGEFYCKCDGCGESVIYGGCEENFRDFVDEVKENGWSITKQDGEWVHLCPDCA